MFLVLLQEQKNRLKRDRADREIERERWDEGTMRQRRSKGSSDNFTTGRESNWGGLEVRGLSVQLWEPSFKKSKPFPISASPLSLSLSFAGLALHHNICFLSPMSEPSPLTVSHLCHSDSKLLWVIKGTPSFSNYYNVIIKEQQRCWTCSDSSETAGHTGEQSLLPDVTG